MEFIDVIIAIVAGLCTCMPLAINLVKYVQAATKEKNWNKLLDLTIEYIEQAETLLETGAERKKWVLAMVKASADTINFDIDMEIVGNMVDNLCDLTNRVNVVVAEITVEAVENEAEA